MATWITNPPIGLRDYKSRRAKGWRKVSDKVVIKRRCEQQTFYAFRNAVPNVRDQHQLHQ